MKFDRVPASCGLCVTAALIGILLTASAHAEWVSYSTVPPASLPSNDIRDVVVAPDSTVWIATGAGLARLPDLVGTGQDWNGAVWQTVPGTSGVEYAALDVLSDGTVWAARSDLTDDLLLERYDANGNALAIDSALRDEWVRLNPRDVTALEVSDDEEVVHLGARRLLYRADRSSGFWSVLAQPLDGDGVVDLDLDPTKTLWIASSDGLWRWGRDEAQPVAVGAAFDGPLASLAVARIADEEWVIVGSSLDDRAWAYSVADETATALARDATAIESRSVGGVTVDSGGRVWTAGERVLRYDVQPDIAPDTWSFAILDDPESEEATPAGPDRRAVVVRSADDTVWIAGSEGVAVLVPRWEIEGREEVLGDGSGVREIEFSEDGGVTWIAGDEGVARFDGTTWQRVLRGESPELENSRALEVDADGRLWVTSWNAGNSRVSVRDAETLELLDGPFGGLDAREWFASDLEIDDEGTMWITAINSIRSFVPPDTMATVIHRAPGIDATEASLLLKRIAIEGDLVVVSDPGDLARFDRSSGEWIGISANGTLVDDGEVEIEEIALRDGRLYVATMTHGLFVLDAATLGVVEEIGSFAPEGLSLPLDLKDVSLDRTSVWIVSQADGLHRVTTDLQRSVRLDFTGRVGAGVSDPDRFDTVRIRDDGEVWLGFSDGAVAHGTLSPPAVVLERGLPSVIARTDRTVRVETVVVDPDGDADKATLFWRIVGPDTDMRRTGPVLFVPSDLGLADGLYTLEVWARDADLSEQLVRTAQSFEVDLVLPTSLLLSPDSGAPVRGTVDVVGTAEDSDRRFARFVLEVRAVGDEAWIDPPLLTGDQERVRDVLGSWDTTSLSDGAYELRLSVEDTLGIRGDTFALVLVDNEFPFADVTSPVDVEVAEGGDVYTAAGDVHVTLPPYALSERTTLTVITQFVDGAEQIEIAPSALFFQAPVRLRIESTGESEERVVFRRDGDAWQRVGGTTTVEDGVKWIDTTIDRTGVYALRADVATDDRGGLWALDAEPRHLRPRSGTGGDEIVISFELGRSGTARVVVYDRDGRPRRELVDGRRFDAGRQVLTWDGRDRNGDLVEVGLYVIALESEGETRTQVVTVGYD